MRPQQQMHDTPARRRRARVKINYALLALVLCIFFGTVGFTVIEGWTILESLYMTVMTVTTVGYGEPRELSATGRVFAICFMLVSVGTVAYALSSVVQSLVHSEIVRTLGVRRRNREMSKLNKHFIICGAGRVGSRIIRELERTGVPFVVIEKDERKVAELLERNLPVLVRDATLEETLREAGIERARGLATCLPDDADNLYVVLTARDLHRHLHIVARAVEEQAEPKLIRAGASRVVAPTIIGSHRMAQALLKPAVADFMDSITAENLELGFEQVEIDQSSPYAGKLLRETDIRSSLDIVIVAVRGRGGRMTFNPAGDARIEAGDLLVAIGHAESLAQLDANARGTVAHDTRA